MCGKAGPSTPSAGSERRDGLGRLRSVFTGRAARAGEPPVAHLDDGQAVGEQVSAHAGAPVFVCVTTRSPYAAGGLLGPHNR
jgi:hypothetical protein